MKTVFLIAATMYSLVVNSQIKKVSMQASGLTCSMCSNAINKALKSLNFVDKVEPDIKTSTFEISFKPNSPIDFNQLKNKVEDAGFFVSKFIATVRFDNVQLKQGEPVKVDDILFNFVNIKDQLLHGDKALRIIDKGFISAKEYKKNVFMLADSKAVKTYHVSIS